MFIVHVVFRGDTIKLMNRWTRVKGTASAIAAELVSYYLLNSVSISNGWRIEFSFSILPETQKPKTTAKLVINETAALFFCQLFVWTKMHKLSLTISLAKRGIFRISSHWLNKCLLRRNFFISTPNPYFLFFIKFQKKSVQSEISLF